MKLTLGQAKTTLARVTDKCATSAELLEWINEAQRRLLSRGRWVGSTVRYRVCVNDACLTWPRQVEAIEAFAVCDRPGVVRNQWYEFVANGPGLLDSDSAVGTQLIDHGDGFCSFDDMSGTTHNIRVQAEVAEVGSPYIILQGYDGSGQWIRTQDGGSWIDGEKVLISTTVQTSTKVFTRLVRVIKPVTNGRVNIYDYDSVAATQVLIGTYDPDETLPNYRRSLIPNLPNMEQCEQCDGTTTTDKQVTIIAKLRHIPVSVDNDFLIMGNLPALKDMVMSIQKLEQGKFAEAKAYEGSAIEELERELESFHGAGSVPVVRTQDVQTWGLYGLNLI